MRLVVPLMLTALAVASQIVRAEYDLIFAKVFNGKTIPIKFGPNDGVERLKEKIKEKEGVPQERQLLIFDDQLMDDEKQLFEYGIVAGSTVSLLIFQTYDGKQRIFVEDPLNRRTLSVIFSPNMTVADFKSESAGIRPYVYDEAVRGHKHLFYKGKMLEDNEKLLIDYNVGAWSTLTAALRYGDKFCNVLVTIPDVKTIAVKVEKNDTVASIKDKINATEGIPPDQQRLIFSDKQRENDSDSLDDLDTDKWPLVTLELRSSPGPDQHVFVKTLGGKIMPAEIGLNDEVSSAKAAIADKTRVPPHLQQLVFRGKLLLDDEKQMSDYDITAWSTLNLIVRPREDPKERVIVRTLTNRSITIDIDLRDTVASLKDKIRQSARVPQYLQRLVFDNKLLEDDDQLLDYKIKNGSTVFMVLYLRGAEPWK